MTNKYIELTPDTQEPSSPIETIPGHEDAFNEEDLAAQKFVSAKIDPADLAQHAAMAAGYFDGPIPTDIAAPPGSSPKRAELTRFLEWRRRTANEIEVLEEAHHRAIEALGGEATTKKKIDALIEADVNEVLRFALASKTLGQIEHQIDVKKIGLDFLDNRTERFVKSAVVEAARESDLGERYLQEIGELREVWLQLVGLRVVVGEHDGLASGPMYGLPKIEIPRFGLPALAGTELQISVNQQALDKAAAPWRALATKLVKNPNADAKIGSAQL